MLKYKAYFSEERKIEMISKIKKSFLRLKTWFVRFWHEYMYDGVKKTESDIVIVSGIIDRREIIADVMKQVDNTGVGIRCTTRTPRNTEQNGVDFYFLSESIFDQKEMAGEFIETCRGLEGAWYATPFSTVQTLQLSGYKTIVLETDSYRSMLRIKKKYPQSISVFIMPPTEGMHAGKSKLNYPKAKAHKAAVQNELTHAVYYDYVIVHESLEKTAAELALILKALRCRTKDKTPIIDKIIAEACDEL